MARPPRPFDALSLLFECAQHGGVMECAFRFPARSSLHPTYPFDTECAAWFYPEHISIIDDERRLLKGKEAVMAIAEARISDQFRACIIAIAPRNTKACDCRRCMLLRDASLIAKIIGDDPCS